MKDVSKVTAMVIDLGIFVENARILGQHMKKVYYCNPSWVTSFPRLNENWIGKGFPEIEVVDSPFDHFEDVDLFCFFDVGHGEMQVWLEEMGKKVWGCRRGEKFEFDRIGLKKLMAKKGLDVGPYKHLKGMDALRGYLKYHEDQFVKIGKYRGMFETFRSPSYNIVEPVLDDLESNLGKFKECVEFCVEEELKDRFEVAVDAYNVDGDLPSCMLYGVEIKDKGYVGKFTPYTAIPECLKKFDKAMAPEFERVGFKSFYSPEMRVGKDKKAYMIDLCARSPSPPNELYQVFYKNLAEIVWNGANGVCIDPDPVDVWGAEILIHSSWACEKWAAVEFPKEIAHLVKLRNGVRIAGKNYAMPQVGKMPEIGAVVGWGSSMDAAVNMALEVADQVEGYFIDIPRDSLEDAKVEIDKAKSFGVWLKEGK